MNSLSESSADFTGSPTASQPQRHPHGSPPCVGSGPRSRRQWGQTLVLMLVALPAFIGVLGLAMDVGNLYFQYYRAQSAVDAAAVSGATCQAQSTSCTAGGSSVATSNATKNDPNMTLNPNPVAAPVNDATYCPAASGYPPCKVTVSATQTVQYYFARLVGVTSGTLNVTAVAVGGPASQYTPASGGTTNMMPIGLDYTTPYESGKPIPLAEKFSAGPGDWGFLAIGGNGDSVLVANIQNGASAPMSIWDGTSSSASAPNEFVATEPGVGNGFKAMNDYHYSTCSGQTVSDYPPGSPCVVCIPLVDWSYGGGCTGKCTVPIKGFGEFFITNVTAHGASSTISASWTGSTCEGGSFSPGGTVGPNYGAIAVQLIQ
jgi:Flp pilus assembly protein TadG